MAEQFLDSAQIPATAEQVGGEGMAQRMRRRGVGQVEGGTQLAHLALHDRGLEWPATRTAEQQAFGVEMVGTQSPVFRDRLVCGGKDRHQPRLAALASDAD